MKVFLGWSGETSNKVATALHGWLPKVIQSVKPYISSEDIAKGARWSSEIAKELQSSNFGIIFVTKENLNSQWIHFESGALSREIEKSYVTPFLFNLQPSDIQGSPLHQFQSATNEKSDIRKLLTSINDRQDGDHVLESSGLTEIFEMWWPKLEAELVRIAKEDDAKTPKPQRRDTHEILEELLSVTQAKDRFDDVMRRDYLRGLDVLTTYLNGRFEEVHTVLRGISARVRTVEQSDSEGTLQGAFAITDGQNRQHILAELSRRAKEDGKRAADILATLEKLPDEERHKKTQAMIAELAKHGKTQKPSSR